MSSSGRNRISDDQRDVLEAMYNGGMVGSGLEYKAKIEKAVEETGLTTSQVKKWIGNHKRVKKVSKQAEETLSNVMKKAKAARGPSSFNLFCSDFFKRGDCKDLSHAEKIQKAASDWKEINLKDKEKYEKLSTSVKNIEVDKLTELQKDKLISRHKKRLVEEIMILADLGCEVSTLVVDNNGEVLQGGSSDGNQFLSSNPEIGLKFREYFGESKRSYTRQNVQNLFNRKYSEATGKTCRVPYLKGGFDVVGMPDGIEFKKPFNYGTHQLRKIMESSNEITFVIKDFEELHETSLFSPLDKTVTMGQVRSLLEKIVGIDSAKKALQNKGDKILEEDVEVVNLTLTDEEKALLYTCGFEYFSPDAWLAVGHNMQHSTYANDLVLPTYTESEEKFWLFLVNEKPSKISNAVFSTKIKGRWLDLNTNDEYNIIDRVDTIVGKNIVRTAHGPLYFVGNPTSEGKFKLPDFWKSAILKVLDTTIFDQLS